MHPVLLRWGPVTMSAYATFHVVAALVTTWLFVGLGRRRGLPRRPLVLLAVAGVVATYVGARMLHLLLDRGWYADDPVRLVSPRFVGFSLYGGLLVAGVVGGLASRRMGLPVWRVADVSVVAAAVGVALVRVGCFLNGCCFGRETDVPWAVTFPVGSPAWTRRVSEGDVVGVLLGGAGVDAHAVHPTQLYELAAAVGVAVLACWLGSRTRDGVAFVTAATLFTAFRWWNWTVRVPPASFDAPGWWYPAFYATVLAALAAMAVHSLAHARRHVHIPTAGRHGRPDRRRQEG